MVLRWNGEEALGVFERGLGRLSHASPLRLPHPDKHGPQGRAPNFRTLRRHGHPPTGSRRSARGTSRWQRLHAGVRTEWATRLQPGPEPAAVVDVGQREARAGVWTTGPGERQATPAPLCFHAWFRAY